MPSFHDLMYQIVCASAIPNTSIWDFLPQRHHLDHCAILCFKPAIGVLVPREIDFIAENDFDILDNIPVITFQANRVAKRIRFCIAGKAAARAAGYIVDPISEIFVLQQHPLGIAKGYGIGIFSRTMRIDIRQTACNYWWTMVCAMCIRTEKCDPLLFQQLPGVGLCFLCCFFSHRRVAGATSRTWRGVVFTL